MTRRALVLFATMCVIWGIPYLLIRIAVRDLSPATLVLARTGLAALLLLPVAAVRGELRPVVGRWLPLLAFAAIEIALPWVLLGSAETRISSSLAALLIAGVPLVAALIARTTGSRERLGLKRTLGLAIGLVGVAAIVGVDSGGASALSVTEMGVVAVCYAVGPVILGRWLADLPALGVIALSLTATALAYVPIAALSGSLSLPSGEAASAVVALAVLCTALAFVLFFALIAEAGPVRSTLITYVNPAVAAVLGVALLGERLTVGEVAGFVLVLGGCALATWRSPVADSAPLAEPA